MTYCDAHLHIVQCRADGEDVLGLADFACSCAHDITEFEAQERAAVRLCSAGKKLLCAFGSHPQTPQPAGAAVLERLLREGRVDAVGEIGFDWFTPELRTLYPQQEAVWNEMVRLAAAYQVPVVIHDRKALDRLYRDSALLARLPAVVFHSFAFGPQEAHSLLRHGIRAYFSFGKPLIAGGRKARACVRELPADRLLFETDAPFQRLAGETVMSPGDIVAVYAAAAKERGMSIAELSPLVRRNFEVAFGVGGRRVIPVPAALPQSSYGMPS